MSEISVTVNEPFPVAMLAIDGRPDLYPRVRIYDSANVLTATLDLSHVANGLYQTTHTFTTEGIYSAVGIMYSDALRTIDAGLERQGETYSATLVKTNINKIMGLQHHNSVIDQNVYTSGQLTSARLRCYDSATNAAIAQATSPAAYNTGLLFTYQITATFTPSGDLLTYMLTQV